MENFDQFLNDMKELGDVMKESMAAYHADAEAWWESVPQEQRSCSPSSPAAAGSRGVKTPKKR